MSTYRSPPSSLVEDDAEAANNRRDDNPNRERPGVKDVIHARAGHDEGRHAKTKGARQVGAFVAAGEQAREYGYARERRGGGGVEEGREGGGGD